MSSLTKQAFVEELQLGSGILNAFPDAVVGSFIDRALRVYSRRLPKVLWDVDIDIVIDQELYDYPTDAINIISVRTSSGREVVDFDIEDQGSGEKIRLGSVQSKSYDDLLLSEYYADPLNSVTTVVVSGFSTFDVEYVMLQDMSSIKDIDLEPLSYYVEYLGLNQRASDSAEQAIIDITEVPASLTDRTSDGASTTVSFVTRVDAAKRFKDLAVSVLEKFEQAVNQVPYGVRG